MVVVAKLMLQWRHRGLTTMRGLFARIVVRPLFVLERGSGQTTVSHQAYLTPAWTCGPLCILPAIFSRQTTAPVFPKLKDVSKPQLAVGWHEGLLILVEIKEDQLEFVRAPRVCGRETANFICKFQGLASLRLGITGPQSASQKGNAVRLRTAPEDYGQRGQPVTYPF